MEAVASIADDSRLEGQNLALGGGDQVQSMSLPWLVACISSRRVPSVPGLQAAREERHAVMPRKTVGAAGRTVDSARERRCLGSL